MTRSRISVATPSRDAASDRAEPLDEDTLAAFMARVWNLALGARSSPTDHQG
jgi:hypothetical protein